MSNPLTDTSARLLTGKASVDLIRARTLRILALGRNEESTALIEAGLVDAVVDDYCCEEHWKGLPVIAMTDSRVDDSLVISCSSSIRPLSAIERALESKARYVTDYFSLAACGAVGIPNSRRFTAFAEDYREHGERYDWLKSILEDTDSRITLERLLRFQTRSDLGAMNGFTDRQDQQYFEPFAPCRPGTVFVDGGGFDGATTRTFTKYCPQYLGVEFFEPEPESMALARERLQDIARVNFHASGLYDRSCTLRFSNGQGSANAIDDQGNSQVPVSALDTEVTRQVGFIKLDLEGAELPAIDGMSRHIVNDHPTMAIAVYHNAGDYWRIPEKILDMRDDYSLFLRHYTEGWSETVMYFVPRVAEG